MITIDREYKDIYIILKAIEIGKDISIIISGGDIPHVGAISIYSKEEGIKTISLKNHKDYIIGEMCINSIKDIFIGNISVTSGIHVDNITNEQINNVYKVSSIIFEDLRKELLNKVC